MTSQVFNSFDAGDVGDLDDDSGLRQSSAGSWTDSSQLPSVSQVVQSQTTDDGPASSADQYTSSFDSSQLLFVSQAASTVSCPPQDTPIDLLGEIQENAEDDTEGEAGTDDNDDQTSWDVGRFVINISAIMGLRDVLSNPSATTHQRVEYLRAFAEADPNPIDELIHDLEFVTDQDRDDVPELNPLQKSWLVSGLKHLGEALIFALENAEMLPLLFQWRDKMVALMDVLEQRCGENNSNENLIKWLLKEVDSDSTRAFLITARVHRVIASTNRRRLIGSDHVSGEENAEDLKLVNNVAVSLQAFFATLPPPPPPSRNGSEQSQRNQTSNKEVFYKFSHFWGQSLRSSTRGIFLFHRALCSEIFRVVSVIEHFLGVRIQ